MEETEEIEVDMSIETYNFLLDYAKKNGRVDEDEKELVNWAAVKLLKEYMTEQENAN